MYSFYQHELITDWYTCNKYPQVDFYDSCIIHSLKFKMYQNIPFIYIAGYYDSEKRL